MSFLLYKVAEVNFIRRVMINVKISKIELNSSVNKFLEMRLAPWIFGSLKITKLIKINKIAFLKMLFFTINKTGKHSKKNIAY